MEGASPLKGSQPHALMFPYPVQGHINPMLQLARKLLGEGFYVTFVNTEYNHARMLQRSKLLQQPSQHLRFVQLADGLPPARGRFNEDVVDVTCAILVLSGPFARLLRSLLASDSASGFWPPVTFIVSDAFCSWMQDVADQFRLPRVALWTTPVHANLAYHFQHILISKGIIPIKGPESTSQLISCIPGIVPLPLSDYISFFLWDKDLLLYQWLVWFCMKRANEALWNLGNNFQELEEAAFGAFKSEVPNFLPIGPLLPDDSEDFKLSTWLEETSLCEEWLSCQAERSVLYVSFGSIVTMEEEYLGHIVRGLEESGVPFLWAIRPDQKGAQIAKLMARLQADAGSRKALLVSWSPQLEILQHKSVGGFFTHCGWNSMIESIVSGVPMLANSGAFAEQNMNAYYIANVWKIGVRLPPLADAKVVKDHILQVMDIPNGDPAMWSRIGDIKRKAAGAVAEPLGSSNLNFRHFIEDMRSRASKASTNLQA